MVLLLASCVLYLLFADVLTPELMMAFYIFFGVGQGFGMSTSMTHGLSCLPEELRTDGSSVFNTLQQLGGSVGVSAVTAVVGAAQAGAVSMEAGTAAGGKMAFMLLTAVIAGARGKCGGVLHEAQAARPRLAPRLYADGVERGSCPVPQWGCIRMRPPHWLDKQRRDRHGHFSSAARLLYGSHLA